MSTTEQQERTGIPMLQQIIGGGTIAIAAVLVTWTVTVAQLPARVAAIEHRLTEYEKQTKEQRAESQATRDAVLEFGVLLRERTGP